MNKTEYTIDEKISCSILNLTKKKLNKSIRDTVQTSLDHQFILICLADNWYILQSYVGLKEFEYSKIDIGDLSKFIYDIRNNFDLVQWNKIFGVKEYETDAKTAYCVINQFVYENKINNRFVELVEKAKYKLKNEREGLMYEHLYLLNKNLDITLAHKYLEEISNISMNL